MIWQLQEPEFENVWSLTARERYQYFIKKVADRGELWSPWDDGWALLEEDAKELVPVWPHYKFAQTFATGEWANYKPRRIDLGDWLNQWIPGIERDRRGVAVFPATGPTTAASPSSLKHDLEVEQAKYE